MKGSDHITSLEPMHTDALIIGFGKAGKTLAAALAKNGYKVVLAEQSEDMYGGTCINIGCIPTKALVISSERHIAYTEAIALKNSLTADLRAKNYKAVQNLANAEVLTGKASFINSHQVSVVTDSKQYLITADKIFINTGSLPFIPPVEGLAGSSRMFTSTSLIQHPVLPEKLVIIGAGAIAVEFASMYAAFGSEVTMLDKSPVFLPGEDEDMTTEMKKIFTRKSITLRNGIAVSRVEPGPATDRVYYIEEGTEKFVEADAILVATGRTPALGGLDVDKAGIELDARGFIKVDEQLKTNIPGIWALGDINGGPQFTYISLDDFRIVSDQLLGSGKRRSDDRRSVAYAIFMTPVYAHVGLHEREAIAMGHRPVVKRIPAAVIPRTAILHEPDGLLKMIIDADTDQILGCTLLCAEAHEIINLVRMAMNSGMSFSEFRNGIYTHPSMSEAFNYFD